MCITGPPTVTSLPLSLFLLFPRAFLCPLFSCSATQILLCVRFAALGKDDILLLCKTKQKMEKEKKMSQTTSTHLLLSFSKLSLSI